VLVDDELTTGRTLINLTQRYLRVNSSLELIAFVCLTDWLGAKRKQLAHELGRKVVLASLLRGSLDFVPNAAFIPTEAPDANIRMDNKDHLLKKNFGRLGLLSPTNFDESLVHSLIGTLKSRAVLVLGTGEFVHLPFRLAAALEKFGFETYFQSTTRSPLLPGEGIHDVVEFEDNYGDGMCNYLYNSKSCDVSEILICYETETALKKHDLIQKLRGRAIAF
jgi:hypothetical protein